MPLSSLDNLRPLLEVMDLLHQITIGSRWNLSF